MIHFTSDLHLFHRNILTFQDEAGRLIRPGFGSIEEMNETIVQNWNSVVRDGDKVYVLGDVTFSYGDEFSQLWSRLRGNKRLLLGNHDDLKSGNQALRHCFKKIGLWRVFHEQEPGFVCSHIPIHPAHFRNSDFNLHGHIHERVVYLPGTLIPDLRYLNICVEKINYTPVSFDWVIEEITRRGKLLRELQHAAPKNDGLSDRKCA